MKKLTISSRAIKDIIEMGESSAHLYKLSQQKLVSFVCQKAAEATGADACILWNYDLRRKRFFIRASHNVSLKYVRAWNETISMTASKGLIGRAIKTNSIQTLPDISKEKNLNLTQEELGVVVKEGFKTIVVIPYNVKPFKTHGVFNLYWRSVHPLSAQDHELFDVLREEVYYSVDSIKHAFEFERQKPQITALYKIFGESIKIAGTQNALREIVGSLSRILRAHAGALWLYDEEQQAFNIFYGAGLPESFIEFSRTKEGWMSHDQGFLKRLSETKKISFYGASKKRSGGKSDESFIAAHLTPNYVDFLKNIPVSNIITPFFIAIPILAEDRVRGALIFYFNVPRTHSASELHALHVASVQIGTALDNTRLYDTLAQESSKLEALFASIDVAVVNLDQRGRFLKMNPWGERLFMKSQADVIGKTLSDLDNSSLLATVIDLFPIEEIRERKHLSKELSWDSPPRVFEVSATSVEGQKDEFFGVTYFTRDITQERLLEGMKTEFLSLAAHQIRSPLTGIKWSLRSVLDKELGDLTPQEESMLEKTYSSTEQLIQLTKELLDVSRIEGGRFFKPKIPIDLNEVIKQVIETSSMPAQQRDVGVEYIPAKQKIPDFMGDKNAIQELIRILVENAIRYTSQGGHVRIHMTQEDQSAVIAVQDTGIGIPRADQPYLFTRFFRATNARQATEGTGLGLYFAKKVVEEYKGKIWFESEENVGTTFYISFPLPHKQG